MRVRGSRFADAVKTRVRERSTRASSSPRSLHYCQLPQPPPTTMERLLTVVFVSSLLLATLADDASSRSSLQYPSLDGLQGRVLGRKGREEPAYHHYRREGEREEQHEVSSSPPPKNSETQKNRVSCAIRAETLQLSFSCAPVSARSTRHFLFRRNLFCSEENVCTIRLV